MSRDKIRSRFFFVTGGVVGAALAYLLDPDRGRARRTRVKDQAAAGFRRVGRRFERVGRRVGSKAAGLLQRAQYARPGEIAPDEATLADKVKTELYRDPALKGRINVNVEDWVVVLRGEVDQPDQIKAVETAVRKIPGVVDVDNLLHLPNTPAPNVEAVQKASGE